MRKLDNKKLDEIGRALVRASAIPERDVERIVADKSLFDSIRKRIAVETEATMAPRRWVSTRIVASAACMVLIAVASAMFVSRSKPVVVADHPVPVSMPDAPPAKRFTQADNIVDRTYLPEPVTMPRPERISSRPNVRPEHSKQTVMRETRDEGDFYALSYAGDPNETERGGRIVRVDIPRTVLFAMGVNIPLENETETVKADLLIGTDGVTRAIRVVK